MQDIKKLYELYHNEPMVLGALQELEQRRESELKVATKYLGNGEYQQYEHVWSEFEEMASSFLHYWMNKCEAEKPHTIEEIVDLQMSCETMLAVLGLDEQQRMQARKQVIDKNAKRGYYRAESNC